jgi:hypothetical protein
MLGELFVFVLLVAFVDSSSHKNKSQSGLWKRRFEEACFLPSMSFYAMRWLVSGSGSGLGSLDCDVVVGCRGVGDAPGGRGRREKRDDEVVDM